ncbi:pre-tRNA nuclear export protein [Oleoguttula sp. CCFEE 5521]
MDAQVENAIDIAFDPRTDQSLKAQAYDFLARLREDPNGWQVCLSLFTRSKSPSEVVRLVSLEIVNNAVQAQQLPQSQLVLIKESLWGYVKQRYAVRSQEADSPSIQNKLTQTFTYLFTHLYSEEWVSFFDDFRELAGDASTVGTANVPGTALYLRIVGSIHDEIADQLIPRTPAVQKRSNDLKDLVRARDVNKIAVTWQEILSRWREVDLNLVEMCLRTIAKWVSWIDIWLVINQPIQNALLELAGQQGAFTSESKEAKARDAAIDTFTETVAKKMAAGDKVELIRYLNLGTIVGQLISSPALAESRNTPTYDTDLAETVARLVNNIMFDLLKVLDSDSLDDATRAKADAEVQAFMPYLLRFFSDEYDEICSAVIPSLTDLMTMLRKSLKGRTSLAQHHSAMLPPVLNAIVVKMKYDETASWGEEDEQTDEAEFQELRKRLHVLQQMVAAVDERLYIDTLSKVVVDTLARLDSGDKPNWRDLDLALHEMFLFGELAVKNGGLYAKSSPSSLASQSLLGMMDKLVNSSVASHPHPAVQLSYMEICVRYVQYFEHNPTSIPKVLETFVAFVHSNHVKVRLRSWYLFQRFVRHLRQQPSDVAQTVIQAIGDLLTIRAEVPDSRDEEDMSSDDAGESADAAFTSQLYLFEAVGCVASAHSVPVSTKALVAKSVVSPLAAELNRSLPAARNRDERAILQIHHIIMAFGTLAQGLSDWTPGQKHGAPPDATVGDVFVEATEAVLLALDNLSSSLAVRDAARHSFSRLLGVLGSRMLPQLPRWIDGLLSSASSNDEMAMFLRLLVQVVYGFKTSISPILDQLLTPLLQKVFAGLSVPATGTDDQIQLKELKLQYLNFILIVMNNDLSSVLVSPTNQATFDPFLQTLTHFAQDPSDPATARLALSVLAKMTSTWGGPDISTSDPSAQPAPLLPGFDGFILSTFAPIPWALLSAPKFNAQDAQIRTVLFEAGSLLWTILRKTGARYREQLSGELRGLGASEDSIGQFLQGMEGDVAGFRKFFAGFVAGK